MFGTTFDNSAVPHEFFGEVTTASFESDGHTANNTSRVWSFEYHDSPGRFIQLSLNYTVAVTVDEPSPLPGDMVNFTITTNAEDRTGAAGFSPPPFDLKVAIDLTGGLAVTGTPTYEAAGVLPVPDSVSYSNGVFNVGTLMNRDSKMNSVTLPVTVASSAVVNEQCLTATLTGNPPPGTGPRDDDISDNVAKVCLGRPGWSFFDASGEVDELHLSVIHA